MKLKTMNLLAYATTSWLLLTPISLSQSNVPSLMNYQGRVTDATGTPIGNNSAVNRNVTFKIWTNPTGGTVVYQEDQVVTIANGEFNALIGYQPGFANAFNSTDRYLGVTVDDGTVAVDPEIAPRQRIVANAYALLAKKAEEVPVAHVLGTLQANGITTAANRIGINAADIATQSFPYAFTLRNDGTDPGSLGNQFVVQSASNLGRKLFMGLNQAGNYGSIQSYDEAGVGPNKLILNPAGGNVGVGTTNPTAKLHVLGASGASNMILQAPPVGTTYVDQLFYNPAGTLKSAFQLSGTNGDLVPGSLADDFFVRSTGRLFLQNGISSGPGVGLTISPNNRVGFNVAAPAAQLDVFANGVPAALFNNGNVGIGVPAPSATRPLTVSGSGPQMSILNAGGTQSLAVAVESNFGTGSGGSGHSSLQVYDGANVRSLHLNPLGGNVGIGNSAPASALDITGAPGQLTLRAAGSTTRLAIAADSSGGTGAGGTGHASIQAVDGSNLRSLHLNPLGGNVGIGTTTPNFKFEVNGNMNVQLGINAGVSADPGYGLAIFGADRKQLRVGQSGVGSWDIFVNGNNTLYFRCDNGRDPNISPITGAYSTSSDARLKKDIEPMTGVLDKVMKLRPVSYHFKEVNSKTEKNLGFLAQEVEPLFPSAVSESDSGYKSMAYSELIPPTIAALQEINLETQRIQQENDVLKSQVDRLEARLEKLEALMEKQAVGTSVDD